MIAPPALNKVGTRRFCRRCAASQENSADHVIAHNARHAHRDNDSVTPLPEADASPAAFYFGTRGSPGPAAIYMNEFFKGADVKDFAMVRRLAKEPPNNRIFAILVISSLTSRRLRC
jgi:hypothetical protein